MKPQSIFLLRMWSIMVTNTLHFLDSRPPRIFISSYWIPFVLSQMESMKKSPPHVLFSTPRALLQLHDKLPFLHRVKRVILDEVDEVNNTIFNSTLLPLDRGTQSVCDGGGGLRLLSVVLYVCMCMCMCMYVSFRNHRSKNSLVP